MPKGAGRAGPFQPGPTLQYPVRGQARSGDSGQVQTAVWP